MCGFGIWKSEYKQAKKKKALQNKYPYTYVQIFAY